MKKYLIVIPVILFVVLVGYGVLVLIDDYFPYGRMRETPGIRPYERRMPVMPDAIIPFTNGESIFRNQTAAELMSPLEVNDSVIKKGESLYFTYCSQCHGKNFDGNGTVGQSFNPLPTDLRSDKVQSFNQGLLFKNISYGIPAGRQPPLAATIGIMDRWQIIAFIKSLGKR
jgi:mono/diheme cytochrome c family protein